MIKLFRKGLYAGTLDIKIITAMRIVKILAVDTGVPWTFRETPYKSKTHVHSFLKD